MEKEAKKKRMGQFQKRIVIEPNNTKKKKREEGGNASVISGVLFPVPKYSFYRKKCDVVYHT